MMTVDRTVAGLIGRGTGRTGIDMDTATPILTTAPITDIIVRGTRIHPAIGPTETATTTATTVAIIRMEIATLGIPIRTGRVTGPGDRRPSSLDFNQDSDQ